MKINMAGLDIITRHEGFRPKPYDDGTGTITIGYGHTRSAIMPSEVTEDEALTILKDDVAHFEFAVGELVEVPINENQFAALVSFTFNLGEGNLGRSTLLKKLNAGDYVGAANEFGEWVKAGRGPKRRTLAGLVKRRAAEGQLFRTPPPAGVQVSPVSTRAAWITMTTFDDDNKPTGMDPNYAEGMAILILPSMTMAVPGGDDEQSEVQEAADRSGGEVDSPGEAGTGPQRIG